MWLKNLQVYRLPAPWAFTPEQMQSALQSQAFTPACSSELLRSGWVSPSDNEQLVHTVNRQMILCLRTEKKLLPSSVINQVAKAKAAELEEQQGFPPGKKAMKELKECVADELLPRAFSVQKDTWVWIDPVNGWLVVDTPAPSRADDVIKMLLKAVDKMPLESLRVQRSPVAAMTGWLEADEAPHGFTVDQDAELRATGESRAKVRYVKHSLDPEDVRRHIAAGKQSTRLAMTWEDRVSFVLTESLAIKSVKPLAIIQESEAVAYSDDERFDNDITLMTAELSRMLADIVNALGGEVSLDGVREVAPADVGDAPRLRYQLQDEKAGSESLRGDEGVMLQFPGAEEDELYGQAVRVVQAQQRASISLIQRHLRIGYNRAARLLEQMEKAGVVSVMQRDGSRTILAA